MQIINLLCQIFDGKKVISLIHIIIWTVYKAEGVKGALYHKLVKLQLW